MSEFWEWCLLGNCSFECSVNRFWFFLKSCFGTAYGWVNQVTSTFTKFLLFFVVPVLVKLILPEYTGVWVSLVFALAVGIFEQIGVWFALLGFESWGVSFLVYFAAPCELSVMFRLVRLVALDTFCLLDPIWECWISPLPAVLALGNIWIHVGISNSSDIAFYIEASVN